MKKKYKFHKVKLYFSLCLFCLVGSKMLIAQKNGSHYCDVCEEYKESKPKINKSDIAIWADEISVYKDYDVDLIVQAMDIFNEQDIPKWKAIADEVHGQGKLFYAALRALTPLGKSFEYLMSDPGIQQSLCLDFNLNSIRTPWMANKSFKDVPIRFFCGNNPRFRAYLRHQVYMMSQVGVDGIMVDDFTGSPASYIHGGCFCEYCMTGFREYIQDIYSYDELKEYGIDDINTFNYRDVVLKYADDLPSMRLARANGEIPLDKDFQYFLYKSDADLFASLKEMACRQSGKYIDMGWDNIDFQSNRGIFYDFLDSYYTECNYQTLGLAPFGKLHQEYSKEQKDDEKFPPEISYIYKFSDWTGKWFTPTPAPHSWGAFKVKGMDGLLKTWIAFSYANGAIFRYPRKGWCFGPTSRWYYPPKEEMEPVYNFIRENKALFDDYEPIEQVGVLYAHNSGRSQRPLKYVCGQLVDLNIPFGTPVAGDNWLSNRIKEDDIDRFELMIIPEDNIITADQQAVIESWKSQKPVIYVKEGDDIKKLLKSNFDPLLSLESKNKVWLFPRHNPADKKAPVVCHLINHDYDANQNKHVLQENIKVRLDKKILEGFNVADIKYFAMGQEPVSANYSIKGENIMVDIPFLDLWGALTIEKE